MTAYLKMINLGANFVYEFYDVTARLTVEPPDVLMSPNVSSPVYSRVDAPLTSASSLPSRFIPALLAPPRFTLASLTEKIPKKYLLHSSERLSLSS